MLRASAFALAFGFAFVLACEAARSEVEMLVVGSVRDSDGKAVTGAVVRASDARGQLAGEDRTDGDGTFAIHLSRVPVSLEIRCRHCATERVAASTGANLAIFIRRYTALESDVPDANDLEALPYGRIIDVLGLIPYALPSKAGLAISDRGLGGGHGLIADDGAPLADLATGRAALLDFPDRSVRRIAVTRANDAFNYGPDAGGGVFALDALGDAPSGTIDAGPASAVAFEPLSQSVRPSFAVSSDNGDLARRYDLDVVTPYAGGQLRLGLTNATERIDQSATSLARDFESARLAYATASRTYRTSFDISTSRVAVAASGAAGNDYFSAYDSASFRIERPGIVTLAAGMRATQLSTGYADFPSPAYDLDGRAAAVTGYSEAHLDEGDLRIDAGLAETLVTTETTLENARSAAAGHALIPTLAVRKHFSGGFYARAGYSESLRLPTLLESAVQPEDGLSAPLERGELLDSALGFDSGARVKAEAIAYREFTRGSADRRLDGLGGSVAWQISPYIGLRAWFLRTDPLNVVSQPYAATTPASRQVLWASYQRPGALRVDALLHRDVALDTRAVLALDADVLVPYGSRLAIDVTTSRTSGVRRYGVGVRLR